MDLFHPSPIAPIFAARATSANWKAVGITSKKIMANGTAIRPSHLLLLPSPPAPVNFASLSAAYAPALTSVLQQLTNEARKATLGALVDIVLPCPELHNNDASRGSLYAPIQALVAGVYKLLCVIAAKKNINIEDHEGIDARVILLSQPRTGSVDTSNISSSVSGSLGPIIDLQTLAICQRNWKYVFAVDGEEGESLLKQFLLIRDAHMSIRRVPGGVVSMTGSSESTVPNETSEDISLRYQSVILGGTFDHLHIGHKLLLTMFAFVPEQRASGGEQDRCYTIGITNDEMLKNKSYAEMVESWAVRQAATATFLNAILDFRPPQDANEDVEELDEPGPNGHAIHVKLSPNLVLKYVEIQDPYGPTITVEDLAAIVISAETRSGGKAVNEKRSEKGWHELVVFEVDVLDPEDPDDMDEKSQASKTDAFEAKISSTKIRKMLSDKGERRKET